MHEDSTQEEEMRRQKKRTKVMKDMTRKIRSKGRMDAENGWWVVDLLAAQTARRRGSTRKKKKKKQCKSSIVGLKNEKKRKMRKGRWRKCINRK